MFSVEKEKVGLVDSGVGDGWKGSPSLYLQSRGHLWTDPNLKEQIHDLLEMLEAENKREKKEVHPAMSLLDVTSAMAVIWQATRMFSLSQHVKYIAFELFQRYMISHMESLLEYVMTTTGEGRKRERLLKAVERKVADQAPLRAVTCVMIASKLVSHKKSMTSHMSMKCLKAMKVMGSPRVIAQSERIILEQLESRCYRRSSMVVYVGIVVWVGGLGGGDLSQFRNGVVQPGTQTMAADQLLTVALSVLDLVHLDHQRIYLDLYTIITGLPSIVDRHRAAFSNVMADRILMAAAVVAAAALIAGSEDSCVALVASFTHHATTVSCRDILTLASCIIRSTGLPLQPLALLANP